MKILLYLLLPVLVVAVFAIAAWVRNRQPTSLESGVDAFRREMTALSPEARPLNRRRPEQDPDQAGDPDAGRRPPPRRQGGPGGPAGPGRPSGPVRPSDRPR